MNVRLVASSDNQAVMIRDHVLPLLREWGAVQIQHDMVRLTELRIGVWTFRHWTPFNELGQNEASSPSYRHALERQRTKRMLPYGLDVWRGADPQRVLRILWAEDGTMEVMNFVPGPWEEEVFLLRAAQMANHAGTRTTQLYDRRREDLSPDEVEKIRMRASKKRV